MTAIKPNLNFDNEIHNIVPYAQSVHNRITPQEQFMKPKPHVAAPKRKTKKHAEPVATTMHRWFTM